MDELRRLADGGGGVADMISAARHDGPGPAAMERMLGRLEVLERGGPPAGGGGALPWIAGALLIGGAIALYVATRSSGDRPAATEPAPTSEPVAAVAPTVEPLAAAPTVEPLAEPGPARVAPDRAAVVPEPAIEAPVPRHVDTPAVAPEPARPPSELALVDRARTALVARRWRDALAAAAEHAERYPAGILAEEREAIAIEALARSGRRPAAVLRLDELVRRSPRSSYRRHLERLVGR